MYRLEIGGISWRCMSYSAALEGTKTAYHYVDTL
jgi:hypothetical protein